MTSRVAIDIFKVKLKYQTQIVSKYSDLNIHFDFYLPCKLVNVYIVFEVQLPILHSACQHQTLALNFWRVVSKKKLRILPQSFEQYICI